MRKVLISLALMVCASAWLACGPARDLAGTYEAVDPREGPRTFLLELKEDGRGSWRLGHEDFAFSWEKRGDALWLHSKSGGVISGTIQPDRSIQIALPGVGSFLFIRKQP
ncbi:MAG: hypothetical protein MUF52_16255 [Syntrophobacteraceae bacterium]|jgi:hypothetical protein|nr:hypothetical protein [Syntrophobacteraceae bacterium]